MVYACFYFSKTIKMETDNKSQTQSELREDGVNREATFTPTGIRVQQLTVEMSNRDKNQSERQLGLVQI